MTFKPNELGHDQHHWIVSSNDPILCTCVRLGMENNVDFWCFPFLCIKNSFSIFWSSKRVFCETLPNIWSWIGPQFFYKIIDHILRTNHQMFHCPNLSTYFSWKIQTSAELVGNRSNLNYWYLIVCSWFFPKIIFSFTSIYIIIGPIAVLQDSTPS
jgi:hypothetical protein